MGERCLSFKVSKLDGAARSASKEASRDWDERRVSAGEVSPAALRRENSFFASLDFSKFKMVAIGGKPIVSAQSPGKSPQNK
jgi:hypothetical protein